MSFTVNKSYSIVNGTSLQGYINAKYDELVEIFGKPTDGDGEKVDAEWRIKFSGDTVATIYNWKNGKAYCGSGGLSVEDITKWHIGGFSQDAVERVQVELDKYRFDTKFNTEKNVKMNLAVDIIANLDNSPFDSEWVDRSIKALEALKELRNNIPF